MIAAFDEAPVRDGGIGVAFLELLARLAIAKRIVERYEGRIWAESTVGQGAVFWFALPAAA